MADVVTRRHISLDVLDQPGALGVVTTVFGRHGVPIANVSQQLSNAGASMVIATHRATEAATLAPIADVRRLEQVCAVTSVIRIEGD
ncbi:hypothetical protein [Micromonospora carbonacea]|uniref:hypothetical protein n=1 Tax=Micromonospora carbonacea TaxID=47853 RepID=UPI003D70DC7B